MKIKIAMIGTLVSISMAVAESEFVLPPEIATGIATSRQSESLGDLAINGVNEIEFLDYIKANWMEITKNIESLPLHRPPSGFLSTSEKQSFNASVSNFASACECLPPEDYVEFLEEFLSLYESNRITIRPISLNFLGNGRKYYFLAVNWEHPQVRSLCSRAISLLEERKEGIHLTEALISISKGELADQYLVEDADDWPLPETLPGIKLKRPFGSMIPMIERLTGKKVPPDPNFPDENPARPAKGNSSGLPEAVAGVSAWGPWRWTALVASLCALFLALFKVAAARQRTR